MESLLTADNLVALFTLTVLEIVLGIDNIIFISILAAKLSRACYALSTAQRRTRLSSKIAKATKCRFAKVSGNRS